MYSRRRGEGVRQFETHFHVSVLRGDSDLPVGALVQASASCTRDEVSNGVFVDV